MEMWKRQFEVAGGLFLGVYRLEGHEQTKWTDEVIAADLQTKKCDERVAREVESGLFAPRSASIPSLARESSERKQLAAGASAGRFRRQTYYRTTAEREAEEAVEKRTEWESACLSESTGREERASAEQCSLTRQTPPTTERTDEKEQNASVWQRRENG